MPNVNQDLLGAARCQQVALAGPLFPATTWRRGSILAPDRSAVVMPLNIAAAGVTGLARRRR